MKPVAESPGPVAGSTDSRGAYRPEIDGLRAIAVTIVVLAHLRVHGTSGGFVGVDLFFVISGYLIASTIRADVAAGRFSFADFYERRVRRIVPALFVTIAATDVFAAWRFFPEAFVRYAQSTIATTLAVSNLYFFETATGYFTPAYSNILLHTWSLGVEEQFYLVFPIALVLAARARRSARRAVVAAALVSFAAACWQTFSAPDFGFYMPQLRAWELLCGALVAYDLLPPLPGRLAREVATVVAWLWLGACVARYSETTPFPGVTALLPCAATVVLIVVGRSGGATACGFLTWRPVAGIGVISYSVYLWHWPIIVALRLGTVPGVRDRTPLGVALVLALSIAAGWLSWKFVERPFRRRPGRFTRTQIFRLALASALVLGVASAGVVIGRGEPARFPPRALAIAAFADEPSTMRSGTCFIEDDRTALAGTCLDARAGRPSVLLFGDSHAASLWYGLQRAVPNVRVLQATASSCAPTLGDEERSFCSRLRRRVFEEYLGTHRIDAVVLTERWQSMQDLTNLEPAIAFFRARSIPITIVGPVPEYTAPLPVLLALGIASGDPGLAERNRVGELAELDRDLRSALASRAGVAYASLWDEICAGAVCRTSVAGGVPILRDGDHFTDAGSIDVVERLVRAGRLAFARLADRPAARNRSAGARGARGA